MLPCACMKTCSSLSIHLLSSDISSFEDMKEEEDREVVPVSEDPLRAMVSVMMQSTI